MTLVIRLTFLRVSWITTPSMRGEQPPTPPTPDYRGGGSSSPEDTEEAGMR